RASNSRTKVSKTSLLRLRRDVGDHRFCETDSGGVYGATQLLELEQHREHTFELSIEMDLVTGEAFEPIRIDCFAKCLLPDQRPIVEFLAPLLVPGQDLILEEALQARGVGAVVRLLLVIVLWRPAELLLPPRPGIVAQRGRCAGISRGRRGRQH